MLSWVSGKILNWCGWSIVGRPPGIKKYIVIVAPHTSNWDFFLFLLLKFRFKLDARFLGKHTIFIGPLGFIIRKIGGIPVNRSKTVNMVDSIAEIFNSNESLILGISPEGTRSYSTYWKSGFYYIALKAKVPIQTCFLDTRKKEIGFDRLLYLTGDSGKDLNSIRAVYAEKSGINPALFSDIAFQNRDSK